MTEFLRNNRVFIVIGVNGLMLLAATVLAALLLYTVSSVDTANVTIPPEFYDMSFYAKYVTITLGICLLIFAGAVVPIIWKREDENANISSLAKSFEKQAVTDALTELPNRRFFEQAFDAYLNEFNRLGKSFGLLVLDLDHFKSVNDTHGHDVGDLVLREVALRLNAITREHDIVARLGGEEFAVLTPYANKDQLMAIAERYRASIESLKVDLGKTILNPTVSIGVATNDADIADIHVMFKKADHKLYEAKRNGRNRVAA